MKKYKFDSYSKCCCGAITVYAGSKSFSCKEENFAKFFGNLKLSKLERLKDSYCCDHCANHYGLDLCACGSGEAPEDCTGGYDCCGHPMQSLDMGYTSVRASDALGQARDSEINEKDLTGNLAECVDLVRKAMDAKNAAKVAVQKLKQGVLKEIESVALPGVTQISDSPDCFVVSMSAVKSSRNLALAAEYYSQKCQADLVGKAIGNCGVSVFMEKLQAIADKKAVVVNKQTYQLNEKTVEVIRDFLERSM